MDNDEKEQWIDAMRAELKSFGDLDVFDEVAQEEAKVMKTKGRQPPEEAACQAHSGKEAQCARSQWLGSYE
eukprot:3522900-Prorocentrum_lima.AAC.1